MKHEQIISGSKYTGTDLGSPGADILGERFKKEIFRRSEISALADFEARTNHQFNNAVQPSRRDRVKRTAKSALVLAGLTSAFVGAGKYAGDEKQQVHQPAAPINYLQEGVQPKFISPSAPDKHNK